MKALIPAAGHGTRFAPWTKLVPKEMLPVGSRPAIAQIVDEAVEAGADEVVIVTSPEKPLLKKWFEIEPAHVKIAWLDRQLAKLVTGGTLWAFGVLRFAGRCAILMAVFETRRA